MKTRNVALALAASLAACHGKDQGAAPAKPVEKGLAIPVSTDPRAMRMAELQRMHRIAGRWQNQPGSMPGGRNEWAVLTVSNDSRFVLEIRGHGPDPKVEAVNAAVRGKIAWTPEGVLVGSGSGARAALRGFDHWRGSFPRPEHMTVRSATGASLDLTYRGF